MRSQSLARSVTVRAALLLGSWLLWTGAAPGDVAVGVVTTALAVVASLRLLPPGERSARLGAVAGIGAHLLRQSVVGGADVAWRALSPRLPLRPGFVSYPLRLPAGTARDAFCALTSVVPGTVPSGCDAGATLLVHCLDVGQPVADGLAADEARLASALGVSVDA